MRSYLFTRDDITDKTPMIQAALNYAMQNGLAAVCLDDGKYKTTDTLQQGWGETFRSLSFVSCNQGRAAFYELQGVQIIPTKIDRCALNIQGGRMVGVRGISFVGRNNVYIDKVINSGAAFPTTEAGWFDPALVPSGNNPGGLKNHSPYAAVCIDAYAGAAPADAYPGQNNIPSWTGLAGQYNRKLTSDVEITNVQCIGLALCVNSKPAGDGNGDFVKVDKLDCQYSTYCISIGNTQARSTSIKNITANRVYAVLTNNRFGLGLGVLDGPIENISLGESYQFFNLGALSYFGNTTVRNIYGEAFVRVGSFSNGASFTS